MPPTDWFRDARWGVFTHYLADADSEGGEPRLSADDWNRRVDGFDAGRLAAQLQEAGAGYYFLTLARTPGTTAPLTPPMMPSSDAAPASAPGGT